MVALESTTDGFAVLERGYLLLPLKKTQKSDQEAECFFMKMLKRAL